jgi:hypothetical protein
VDKRNVPRFSAISAAEALENSVALGQVAKRIAASNHYFAAVKAHLPPALRAAVRAGPLDDKSWCLLVTSSATAAKLKQLLPLLKLQLSLQNIEVPLIRVKILMSSSLG